MTLKLRLLSDTHNEMIPSHSDAFDFHKEHLNYILPSTKHDKDIVLILAGDLWNYSKPISYIKFIDYIKDRYKAILLIEGNHEWYGSDYPTARGEFCEYIKNIPNLHFLNGTSIEIDDVVFIGATLWTDFKKECPLAMQTSHNYMNDYNKIKNENSEHITPSYLLNIHHQELEKITTLMEANKDRKTVVITHHGPSYQSIDVKYRDAGLSNYSFSSNLDDLILKYQPAYWFHGHTHTSMDYYIEKTRVITNPVGYKHGWKLQYENTQFNKKLLLEI